MYENVALAITINEQGDSLTGSMVDDIFYILQKCARRASETGRFRAWLLNMRITSPTFYLFRVHSSGLRFVEPHQ